MGVVVAAMFNAGAAVPRGELHDLFSTHPYFQVEGGNRTLFGAARIRDYQQFLPFGGRVIVPLAGDRVQLHAGGGGAYFRYSERIRQPFADSGFRLDCVECATRDGIGYYGLVGFSIAVDRAQNFRVGFGSKVYRGGTEGDAFGAVPGRETVDRSIKFYGSLGFSF